MLNFCNYISKNDAKGLKAYRAMESNTELFAIFCDIYNRATNRYWYENLPETMSTRFIEDVIFFRGCFLAAKDPELGFLSLFANLEGNPTIYGDWTKAYGTGANGYNKRFDLAVEVGDNSSANAVLIRDNPIMVPPYIYAILYATQMNAIKDAIISTADKLKNPYLILVDQTMKDSVEKVISEAQKRGTPAIIGSKKLLDANTIQLFNTDVDASAMAALWDTYDRIDSQCRSFFGEDNTAAPSKRERLVVAEATANDDVTDKHIEIGRIWRQKGFDTFNEIFGENVIVHSYEEDKEAEDYELLFSNETAGMVDSGQSGSSADNV